MKRAGQIVFTGVESSGKTTLASRLATATGWPLIPEFARTDPAVLARAHGPGDLQRILHAQHAAACAFPPTQPILCDTGAIVLSLWSEIRFHRPLPGAEEIARCARLHLLCAPDLPWESDPLRESPNLSERLELHARYLHRLRAWGIPHVTIRGNALEGRFHQAASALRNVGFAVSE